MISPPSSSRRFRLRPKIRTVLIACNLLILTLPLFGIAAFRLYESEIIKQTEASLIGQGALVAAMFREEMLNRFENAYEQGEDWDLSYGNPVLPEYELKTNGVYAVLPPRLDLAEVRLLPPGADAEPPGRTPDDFALAAGEALFPVLHSARDLTLSGIRIVDRNGIVVASTGTEWGQSLLKREEVAPALAGAHVSLLRKRSGEEPPLLGRRNRVRVFVAIPVIHSGRVWGAVILSRTPVDLYKSLYLIRGHLILAGCFLVLAALLVTVLTALFLTRPVARLIRQGESISRGETSEVKPLRHPGTREVDRLSHTMADMARALSGRAEYANAFANNVSHGFRTPITSMSLALQMLQNPQGPLSEEDRARLLAVMEQGLRGLNGQVQKLLDLTRADMALVIREATDVRSVIRGTVRLFREKGLNVRYSPGGGLHAVDMEKKALEAVLENLLDNARVHGGKNASVRIESSWEEAPDGNDAILIRVEDDGGGVSLEDQAKIFQPFSPRPGNGAAPALAFPLSGACWKPMEGGFIFRNPPGEPPSPFPFQPPVSPSDFRPFQVQKVPKTFSALPKS